MAGTTAASSPPGPPTPDQGGAEIFHLDFGKRQRDSATGGPAVSDGEQSAQAMLACTVEAMFAADGRTLTDDRTAQAFTITLGAVQLMLDGALAQGVVSKMAHRELDAMLEGIRATPGVM